MRMERHVRHTTYRRVGVSREHTTHSTAGTHSHIQCPVAQVLLSQLSPPPHLSNPVGASLREVSHQMKRSRLSQQPPACISPEIKGGISVATELNSLLELIRERFVVEKYLWIVLSLVEFVFWLPRAIHSSFQFIISRKHENHRVRSPLFDWSFGDVWRLGGTRKLRSFRSLLLNLRRYIKQLWSRSKIQLRVVQCGALCGKCGDLSTHFCGGDWQLTTGSIKRTTPSGRYPNFVIFACRVLGYVWKW